MDGKGTVAGSPRNGGVYRELTTVDSAPLPMTSRPSDTKEPTSADSAEN